MKKQFDLVYLTEIHSYRGKYPEDYGFRLLISIPDRLKFISEEGHLEYPWIRNALEHAAKVEINNIYNQYKKQYSENPQLRDKFYETYTNSLKNVSDFMSQFYDEDVPNIDNIPYPGNRPD